MNVPSRRKDISIKEDLIEEVARIYGYDDIPSTLPVFKDVTSGELTDRQFKTRTVKETRRWARPSYYLFIGIKNHATDFALQNRPTLNYLCLFHITSKFIAAFN